MYYIVSINLCSNSCSALQSETLISKHVCDYELCMVLLIDVARIYIYIYMYIYIVQRRERLLVDTLDGLYINVLLHNTGVNKALIPVHKLSWRTGVAKEELVVND